MASRYELSFSGLLSLCGDLLATASLFSLNERVDEPDNVVLIFLRKSPDLLELLPEAFGLGV